MAGRILVAEDDPKQANLVRLYLEREGHSVRVVGDGRAALDEYRSRRPDLVILDVMMPVVDGLDVCRIMRAESDVPLLLLTARTTEEDILLGLDIGADDYVTKPYSPRSWSPGSARCYAGPGWSTPGFRRSCGWVIWRSTRAGSRYGSPDAR